MNNSFKTIRRVVKEKILLLQGVSTRCDTLWTFEPMLLFWILIDKTQMSKPTECAATFFKTFKTWRSILVSHLGLQSVSYRVETPCICNNVLVLLSVPNGPVDSPVGSLSFIKWNENLSFQSVCCLSSLTSHVVKTCLFFAKMYVHNIFLIKVRSCAVLGPFVFN